MTIVLVVFYVLVLGMWAMVTYALVTLPWGPPEEDGEDGDGGIPPEDDPSGPEIDWGAWAEMEYYGKVREEIHEKDPV